MSAIVEWLLSIFAKEAQDLQSALQVQVRLSDGIFLDFGHFRWNFYHACLELDENRFLLLIYAIVHQVKLSSLLPPTTRSNVVTFPHPERRDDFTFLWFWDKPRMMSAVPDRPFKLAILPEHVEKRVPIGGGGRA